MHEQVTPEMLRQLIQKIEAQAKKSTINQEDHYPCFAGHLMGTLQGLSVFPTLKAWYDAHMQIAEKELAK